MRDHQYPNDLSSASGALTHFPGMTFSIYDVSSGGNYRDYNQYGSGNHINVKKKGLE
jgi:hypothetical protein